jgi:hypothetical protein
MKLLIRILMFCMMPVILFGQPEMKTSDKQVKNIKKALQSIDPASEWRVDSYVADPPEYRYECYKDYIDGDTVINGVAYLKIYRSGYERVDLGPNSWYLYFTRGLHGFLREENHKWYTFFNDQDQLLFDFTMEVNDTVTSAFTFPLMGAPILVTAIDSVMVDGANKIRFHINPEFGAEYIIEDIGATSGLFENMSFFEWGSELICFAKNSISLWGTSTDSCDLDVSLPEKKIQNQGISVYPNPAGDYTNVFIPPGFREANISLMDPFGRIVLHQSQIANGVVKIPLTSLTSGLYQVLVETDQKRLAVKLVIQ